MDNSDKKFNCIIDCRVSDRSQVSGNGLDDQERAGKLLAYQNGWKVIKIFKQPHSATTTERDDIEEKISFIKNSKEKVDFYIVRNINRFTRVGSSEYLNLKEELEKLGVQLRDTYGIIQPKKNTLEHLGDFRYRWSVFSPSEGAEILEAHKGKEEVRDILTRMIGAEIKLYQEGYALGPAPDGMRNTKIFVDGKNRTIREEDPERVHFFKKMFELAALGVRDEEAVMTINNMGFKTPYFNRYNDKKDKVIGRGGGNPLTVKHYQKHLRNLEYASVRCGKWNNNIAKKNQYLGIVSIELFNNANKGKIYILENNDGTLEILKNFDPARSKRKLKKNPLFPYDFILCPLCKELGKIKPFTHGSPTSRSGKPHPTYSCGRKPHKYFGVNKAKFESDIEKYIMDLKFKPEYLESLELTFLNKYREREKEIIKDSAQMGMNVSELQLQQAAKLDAIVVTTSPLVRKRLEEEYDKLEIQIQEAKKQREEIEITEGDIKEFIKDAKSMMAHPYEWLLDP